LGSDGQGGWQASCPRSGLPVYCLLSSLTIPTQSQTHHWATLLQLDEGQLELLEQNVCRAPSSKPAAQSMGTET